MKKVFLLCIVAACVMASCKVSQLPTRGSSFPGMYRERPVTLVILPPCNRSDSLGVERNLASAFYKPLCEKGYCVIPPAASAELLAGYGVVDSAMAHSDVFLAKLREDLGADATLFSDIRTYSEGKSRVRITLVCSLLSTKTGRELYSDRGIMHLSRSKDGLLRMPDGDLPGTFGIPYAAATAGDMVGSMALGIVGGVLMSVTLSEADYVSVLQDLPAGKYDESIYLKDSTWTVASPWLRESGRP